jgi:hypothetical protein
MKHIFSDRSNRKKLGLNDRYYRIWTISLWVLSAFALLSIILRFIPETRNFSQQVFIAAFAIFIILSLVLFIMGIVKYKVVDWMYIFFTVLYLYFVVDKIISAGGLCAIFSAT